MAMTRRALVKAGIITGVAAFIPQALLAGSGSAASSTAAGAASAVPPEYWMDRALLEGHLNTLFDIREPGQRKVRLKLVQVADLPGLPDRDHSFSARFTGPVGRSLPQKTYSFQHPSLGQFDAFLVPIERPTRKRQTYEVVVNRVLH